MGTRSQSRSGGEEGTPFQLLADMRDEILVEMLATIQAGQPAYTRFESLEEEDAWAETLAWFLDLFIQLVAEGRDMTVGECKQVRVIGATRAAQGFHFDPIKASIRSAVRVASTRIVREHALSGDDDRTQVDPVLGTLDRFGGTVEELMFEGFSRSGKGDPSQAELIAQLLQDVVDRRVRSSDELARRARELDCESEAEQAVLMTLDSGAAEHIAASLTRVHLAHRARSRRGAHSILVVPVPPSGWTAMLETARDLAREARTTLLACGPCVSVRELYDRYLLAVSLLPHLRVLVGDQEVVAADELLIEAIIAALPRDVRLAFRRLFLSRLDRVDWDREAILEHLAVNVRFGFSAVAVRSETGRNKKTVYDWRDRVTDATGCSLVDPRDQAILTLLHFAVTIDS